MPERDLLAPFRWTGACAKPLMAVTPGSAWMAASAGPAGNGWRGWVEPTELAWKLRPKRPLNDPSSDPTSVAIAATTAMPSIRAHAGAAVRRRLRAARG